MHSGLFNFMYRFGRKMEHNLHNLINLEAVHLLEEVEVRARRRRVFNARRDPFELSNKEFMALYRVNKRIMENVIDIVSEYNDEPRRLSALDVTTQVKKIN